MPKTTGSKAKASGALEWVEQTVGIDQLQPFERNPRRISKADYSRLMDSLRENGYHQRIIATPDLRVIGGHQRIRALKELGYTAIKVLTPNQAISDDKFRELLVKDNLPFGEFDFDALANLCSAEECEAWGMPTEWLEKLPDGIANAGLTDPDAVPPAPAIPSSVPGDIWLLGNHRVMCGDSTSASNTQQLFNGAVPHLMVTDPPYGVDYDADWRNKSGLNKSCATGKVLNDDRADWKEAWDLFPGHVAYVWHGGLHSPVVAESLVKAGFGIRAQIIWVKTKFAISRGHYHWQHEPAFYAQKPETDDNWRFGEDHETAEYAVKKGASAKWKGGRKQTSVWFIEAVKNETGHSTQKPVMCMQRPIENNSDRGDAVYDPFLGSGSTLIAAEMTGCVCYGMELNPVYVAVIS